ncbi:MAG: hypothetical protein BJ554DRAFT_6390 [Olpidium bornovanus]|uniref:Uncharacterized protein n=1 Tax=Olpidium bornovanus TaxID=278681 RepID=A0A8H8DK89_9FUNG|nr:MAG: hypothetical protein BJ554DRAFT_6390 [Olpidium bornovanus]
MPFGGCGAPERPDFLSVDELRWLLAAVGAVPPYYGRCAPPALRAPKVRTTDDCSRDLSALSSVGFCEQQSKSFGANAEPWEQERLCLPRLAPAARGASPPVLVTTPSGTRVLVLRLVAGLPRRRKAANRLPKGNHPKRAAARGAPAKRAGP